MPYIECLGILICPEQSNPICVRQAAMMKEIYQRGPIACGIDAGPLLKLGQLGTN